MPGLKRAKEGSVGPTGEVFREGSKTLALHPSKRPSFTLLLPPSPAGDPHWLCSARSKGAHDVTQEAQPPGEGEQREWLGGDMGKGNQSRTQPPLACAPPHSLCVSFPLPPPLSGAETYLL